MTISTASPARGSPLAIARPARSWSDHPRGCVRRLRAGGLERGPGRAVPPRARRDHLAAGGGAARSCAGGGGHFGPRRGDRSGLRRGARGRPRRFRRGGRLLRRDARARRHAAPARRPSSRPTRRRCRSATGPSTPSSRPSSCHTCPTSRPCARSSPASSAREAASRSPPGTPSPSPSPASSSSRSPSRERWRHRRSHPARRSSSTQRSDEFTSLLAGAGLSDVSVAASAFTHPITDLDAFWADLVGGTVRASALIRAQPSELQGRIRRMYGERLARWRVDGG